MITFTELKVNQSFFLADSSFDVAEMWQKINLTEATNKGKTIVFAPNILVHTLPVPYLIAMQGLPGAGKSYEARQLAESFDAVIVSTDDMRKKLIEIMPATFDPDPTTWDRDTWFLLHTLVAHMAGLILDQRKSVIYDATNCSQMEINRMEQLAHQHGAVLYWQPIPLPGREEWHQRLAQRPEGLTYWLNVAKKMIKNIPEEMYERFGI